MIMMKNIILYMCFCSFCSSTVVDIVGNIHNIHNYFLQFVSHTDKLVVASSLFLS
jgi:hypothetical protein